MKSLTLVLLLIFANVLMNVSVAQEDTEPIFKITVEQSSQYLPYYLENVYIGMPLSDFENIKDTSLINISEYDTPMWIEVNEQVSDNGIDEVLYKFNKPEEEINSEKYLYQINIKFLDQDDQNDYVNEKFGEPFIHTEENQNEWIFKTDKDYMLIIREYQDIVQIIATMSGAEWENFK